MFDNYVQLIPKMMRSQKSEMDNFYFQFKTYIEKMSPLSELEIADIYCHFKLVTFRKNAVLADKGEVAQYLYYILKGGLRFYYLDKDGEESTRYFAFENTFGAGFTSFILNEPSIEVVKTIESSILLAINRKDFYQLVDRYNGFAILYRTILELGYTYSVKRIGSFLAMDASERIRWVIENQPTLIQRVPNRVIASYLGIKRETLSRLLAKIKL